MNGDPELEPRIDMEISDEILSRSGVGYSQVADRPTIEAAQSHI
jgi:hypothetical protein